MKVLEPDAKISETDLDSYEMADVTVNVTPETKIEKVLVEIPTSQDEIPQLVVEQPVDVDKTTLIGETGYGNELDDDKTESETISHPGEYTLIHIVRCAIFLL